MKHLALAATLAAALGGAAGCQPDLRPVEKKLDDLTVQVGALSRKVDVATAGGGNGAARPPRPPQPDPATTYAVPVDGDPSDGPATAKITLVKAYDYLCPYCERARGTVDELKKKYGDQLRVVYKQLIVHPQAQAAHLAACAAMRQGKFEAMDRLLWDKAFAQRQTDDAAMTALAAEVGLDAGRFASDVKSDDCQRWLQKDHGDLAALGVASTPTFFVNGRPLIGLAPLPAFTALIDEELAKADQRIAAGTKPADYYATWVIAKGEKKLVAAR